MRCLLFKHVPVRQMGTGECAGIITESCAHCGKVFSVTGDPKAIQRRVEQVRGYEAVRERMA